MTSPAAHWAIFCTVIDNYGDIGISWRLARQLATEHQIAVTLWVDDLNSFARICPPLQPQLARQCIDGVTVRHWHKHCQDEQYDAQTVVVIEAFGAELTQSTVQAMATQKTAPAWYNLEYLSAEPWIDGCHKLNSPHPRYALQKRFFFPGFTAHSGGLLRERDLLPKRVRWQQDPARQADFWQQLRLPIPQANEKRISVFCYPTPALRSLFNTWGHAEENISVILPADKACQTLAPLFNAPLIAGSTHKLGNSLCMSSRLSPSRNMTNCCGAVT